MTNNDFFEMFPDEISSIKALLKIKYSTISVEIISHSKRHDKEGISKRNSQKNGRQSISDRYCRGKFRESGIKNEDITQEMIQIKREQIIGYRIKHPDRGQKRVSGVCCPRCGYDSGYIVEANGKSMRRIKCANNKLCAMKYSIFRDTLFENNNLPIQQQLYRVFLFLKGKNNDESARLIGTTQTSVWATNKAIKKEIEVVVNSDDFRTYFVDCLKMMMTTKKTIKKEDVIPSLKKYNDDNKRDNAS